ncbi:MAG: hypothetical protein HQL91_00870 [Magnetococcales bacterium]|nr:hypothetical protein [Magnetococcales bacterium]
MSDQEKQNCWDFFNCTRSRHGARMDGTPCPVSLTTAYTGFNGGMDAGRACWTIEGTFCTESKCGPGDDRGGFGFKKDHCDSCAFKAKVKAEEGENFVEDRRSQFTRR